MALEFGSGYVRGHCARAGLALGRVGFGLDSGKLWPGLAFCLVGLSPGCLCMGLWPGVLWALGLVSFGLVGFGPG